MRLRQCIGYTQRDHVYTYKLRLIVPNPEDLQAFYFDEDHVIVACNSNSLLGSSENNTAVTGLGVMTDRKEVFESGFAQTTAAAIVFHTEYNPAVCFFFAFLYVIMV